MDPISNNQQNDNEDGFIEVIDKRRIQNRINENSDSTTKSISNLKDDRRKTKPLSLSSLMAEAKSSQLQTHSKPKISKYRKIKDELDLVNLIKEILSVQPSNILSIQGIAEYIHSSTNNSYNAKYKSIFGSLKSFLKKRREFDMNAESVSLSNAIYHDDSTSPTNAESSRKKINKITKEKNEVIHSRSGRGYDSKKVNNKPYDSSDRDRSISSKKISITHYIAFFILMILLMISYLYKR